ncbi:MAG: hypothetical protein JWL63_1545 [Rhodocyclales bacterium]|nr:hypothetical protein [Rhodocyclales bacterium]
MPSEKEFEMPKSKLKLWIAVVSAITAAVAIIPPAITVLRATPSVSQTGTGNSAVIGSTVGSNNQTTNTYLSMWVEGTRALVGISPTSQLTMVPAPAPGAQAASPAASASPSPALASEPKDAEPGALGRVVDNASLMNAATWSPEPSRVARLLTFYLHVEATGTDEKQGSIDVALSREGRDVCTLSLNSRTSPISGGVHYGNSTCHDTLPANEMATYKTKVRSVEMSPVVIRLDYVDAVRK